MPDLLLQDFAAGFAERSPDATALVMDEERMSYRELDQLSDRLVASLVEAGIEPGARVALLMPKHPLTIVAMHAVLKAGGIYVPLDAGSPPARLARIIGSAEPRLLISLPEMSERLAALAEILALPPVWSMDPDPIEAQGVECETGRVDWDVDSAPPDVRVRPEDPAHLIFTSGSTGHPKGVVVTHSMVTHFAEWAVSYFGIGQEDRVSGHPPLHFDLSTFDIYVTLAAGAELNLVPAEVGLDPRVLARWIRERRLTQWVSVPSVLTYMAKFGAVEQDDFPSLKRVIWCGEVFPTPVLAEWMRLLPHVRFTNLYGPTEAAVASSYYAIPEVPADENQPVPIGVACDGEELLVLDDSMTELPAEEIGDLYIGGVGVSPGYWRDPEKTAAAFVQDPRSQDPAARIYKTGDLARRGGDGQFHFVGRADSQIKSRGYRIELGEIENALSPMPGIRECAVVGVDLEGFEGVSICAAYVTDDDLAAREIKAQLGLALPSYMLPVRLKAFPALPKNQNGKVDRPRLREEFVKMEAQRREGRR